MKSFTQAARKKTVAAACIIAFAGVGLLDPAHATFPGENGVIVFSAGGAVQKTGATGGTPTVLAENAHAPAVSPNGKWVAYVDSASRNIWVRNVDGTGAILNVTGNLPPSNPERLTWSPDGQRLAYVNRNSWQPGIHMINWYGAGHTWIDSTKGMDVLDISWSPLGDKLAFNTMREGLWTMNPNGGNMALIVPNKPVQGVSSVGWSPQGRSIVFTNVHPGSTYQWTTYEVDPSGLNVRQIPTPGTSFGSGAVSPDGTQIVGTTQAGAFNFVSRSGGALTPVPGIVNAVGRADWSRVPKTAMAMALRPGGWQPATPLAGDAAFYAAESAVAHMPDNGELGVVKQAVAIGLDGRVYHRVLKIGTDIWTPFAAVPGLAGSAQGIRAKKVAIAGALDGSAQIVIVGDDDLLYHAMRFPDGRWTNGASGTASGNWTVGEATPTSPHGTWPLRSLELGTHPAPRMW